VNVDVSLTFHANPYLILVLIIRSYVAESGGQSRVIRTSGSVFLHSYTVWRPLAGVDDTSFSRLDHAECCPARTRGPRGSRHYVQ